jgi:hypothetical protein
MLPRQHLYLRAQLSLGRIARRRKHNVKPLRARVAPRGILAVYPGSWSGSFRIRVYRLSGKLRI